MEQRKKESTRNDQKFKNKSFTKNNFYWPG